MNGTDVTPVHLGTGEVLERLNEQPADTLAEALHLVLEREAEAKRWADALAVELRRRLAIRQTKLAVFGEWEVEASTSRESVWDGDELEAALQQLVDEGVVRAADVADVITREPVVARSKAKALLARLTGDAHDAVQATCSWREKPGKLTVVRSVQLPAPAPPDPSPDGSGRTPDAVSAPVSEPALSPTLTPEELFS
jgi:hypothetical protein